MLSNFEPILVRRCVLQFFKYTYVTAPNGTHLCLKATTNYTIARSPAFEDVDRNYIITCCTQVLCMYACYSVVTDYDWSSGRWSTWTESRWAGDAINVRYFLQPPLYLEVLPSACVQSKNNKNIESWFDCNHVRLLVNSCLKPPYTFAFYQYNVSLYG